MQGLADKFMERISIRFLARLAFSLFVAVMPHSGAIAGGITSEAAAIMDASTGEILYGKNSDDLRLPASTAKLMTAIIVIEKANLAETVTISPKAARTPSLKSGFKKGDKVTIESLLYAALLKSANDAAVALSEAIAGSEDSFVSLMNQKSASIGATNTRFINASGLPGDGQHITASDLSRIMRYALNYQKLREILATPAADVSTEKGKVIRLRNTDKLLSSDEEVIGGKTGYTYQAKHCFVFAAERNKKTIIVTLLGSPSRKNLWREAKELTDKGFQIMAGNGSKGSNQ